MVAFTAQHRTADRTSHLNNLHASSCRCVMKRRQSCRICRSKVCPNVEQHLQDMCIWHVLSHIDAHLHRLRIPRHDRDVERRHPIAVRRFDIGAGIEQNLQDVVTLGKPFRTWRRTCTTSASPDAAASKRGVLPESSVASMLAPSSSRAFIAGITFPTPRAHASVLAFTSFRLPSRAAS